MVIANNQTTKKEGLPVQTMIEKITEKFKWEIEKFFSESGTSIEQAEEYFVPRVSQVVTELMSAYYEQVDMAILEDRAGRKEAGLVVERKGDPRQVLTRLGNLKYHRTYYQKKDGGYCHPVDEIAGITAYERVSGGVSLALVEAAREVSYARSSQIVTDGAVSRQTVLNKVRQSNAKKEVVLRRKVPVLHVDADEDHVHLQTGRSAIAPLISGYEGIEKQGKRGICKNIFHISEYGKAAQELWEEFLTELERRYDLEGTRIYLHGDGAAWIKTGLEWLPNSVLVLDRYHVNKALKAVVSGIEKKSGSQYQHLLRKALEDGDKDFFLSIRDSLLLRWPEREENIRGNTDYLLKHFEAIHIWYVDPEARRGGATEPHVSNVLSARLSSRPMAWSQETLRRFLPVLAAGRVQIAEKTVQPEEVVPTVVEKVSKAQYSSRNTLGAPDPQCIDRLPAMSGKVTPLYNALRPFLHL